MSTNVSTFEVRVRQKGVVPIKILNWDEGRKFKKVLKMFHIERRTRRQAIEEAERYGDVVSCRKVDASRDIGSIENLTIDNEKYIPVNVNLYTSAIAMDEMVWKKRNKRIHNRHKDKEKTA